VKLKRLLTERIPALVLVSSLVACDSGTQQAQVDEPAAAAPAESTMAADAEAAKKKKADRFANMFVSEISNAFNPGVQIGEQFPAIRALYQGEEITTIDRFIRDRGAIFIAVRSVDW
jgi:hypothetical protein